MTDIDTPGGVSTDNLSRRAITDPCLRSRGHWDQQMGALGKAKINHK